MSPLAGMGLAEQVIEVRLGPLTGMTAVAAAGLGTKEETFYGKTDWEHAEALAASSREGCFFCPEKVLRTTPPSQELVHHARPDVPVPAGDGTLVTIELNTARVATWWTERFAFTRQRFGEALVDLVRRF